MSVIVLDKIREARRIKEALDYLETTFTEPDYVPESPNHADELTEEAYTKSLGVLIEPFSLMLEGCNNAY